MQYDIVFNVHIVEIRGPPSFPAYSDILYRKHDVMVRPLTWYGSCLIQLSITQPGGYYHENVL